MDETAQILRRAWQAHQAGDVRGAESVYREVLESDPLNANAWCYLGIACHDRRDYDGAISAYRRALEIKPRFPVALSNMSNTLNTLGRSEEAVECCQNALALKPDYASAYTNLGAALVKLGKLAEASEAFEHSIKHNPQNAVAHGNLGATLIKQGRFGEAAGFSQQALSLNPRYAEAHRNQALVWLLLGDFERGWDEYEWRWQCGDLSLPNYQQPRWDGEPLEGKTLLLWAEQGLGDTLHMARYAQVLSNQAARIILVCQRPLLALLKSCPGIDELIAKDDPLPPFDFYCPLFSVPRILKTDLDSIPADVPYLDVAPDFVAQWKAELASSDGVKIGIAWQGNPTHTADRQRSIPLAQFAPLAEIPGVELFSLQRGRGVEQLEQVADRFSVRQFSGDFDNTHGAFIDTAAVMKNLDLVVTSDTSIAHLAGALGTPAWVALAISPDWRWLLDRDDSPWYPTMRLFRQKTMGDWGEVFAAIADALRKSFGDRLRSFPRRTTTAAITVEIAPGELIDKITILEIKSERITDPAKLENVRIELATLAACRDKSVQRSDPLDDLTAQLKQVNEALWEIEDDIRGCERINEFGPRFIELARSVYRQNDKRAALKRQISELLGSRLVEEKSYEKYD